MTRRELWDNVLRSARPLYEEREARAIASMFCEAVCGMRFTDVIVEPDAPCPPADNPDILVKINQIRQGRPIQYIIGQASFCDLDFEIAEGALIPRPETEELIRWIVVTSPSDRPLTILDIGTGSGCIAISLARLLPRAKVTGIDISPEALQVAERNNELHKTRIIFRQLDILTETPAKKFDIIVSNPPYVTEREKSLMNPNVLDHEPHTALFVPDSDPLRFYRRIAQAAESLLKPDGKLYFEINEDFGSETLDLLKNHGFTNRELRHDLHGKARMIKAGKRL